MGGGASKQPATVKISSVYTFKMAIGKGSFATVYGAELKEPGRRNSYDVAIPTNVAIKAIDKSKIPQDEISLLQEECNIMEKLSHPNCVGLLEYFDEPDYFYLVLELVSGGELFDQIVAKGFFNEVEAAHATRQVAQALAYLEDKRIVHRDVKPENLIYESNDTDANIKLTDFGLAKDISGEASDTPLVDPCGTPGYVAPEILKGEPYGSKVDTWALGVILFILLCGYPPFYADEQSELFKLIKLGKVTFDSPYWDEVSDGAKQVVLKLIEKDPKKRMSAKQILEEPWVANPDSQSTAHFGAHVLEGIEKIRNEKWQRAIFKIRAMKGFGSIVQATKSFGAGANAGVIKDIDEAATEAGPGDSAVVQEEAEEQTPAQEEATGEPSAPASEQGDEAAPPAEPSDDAADPAPADDAAPPVNGDEETPVAANDGDEATTDGPRAAEEAQAAA